MATNQSSQFQADIESYIAEETLALTQRQLVAYQFGDKLTLPKGRGRTYTATRFPRVPLPQAPLSEGVPPIGETMTIQQVSAIAQQWGDKITLTDIAEMTIKHPILAEATKLIALQVAETDERNTFNGLMAGTQVNYVNQKGSRGALASTDVLDPHTVNRTVAALTTIGAWKFNGSEMTDEKLNAEEGGKRASEDPRKMPHYVALIHPLVSGDFSENSTVVQAWSYSDINRLYNFEIGTWRGMRFCESNMIPSWTGFDNTGYTATAGTSGNLPTSANYYVIVTGTDLLNQYESQIYAVSAAKSVTGPFGSISVVLPTNPNYTYNVYIGTTTSPTTLGLSASGPTSGPLQGQAVQLAAGSTAVITGIGTTQVPPAAPASGVTVYPTFVFGKGAYGVISLDELKMNVLLKADKSDPNNQLRVIGWTKMYGFILMNQNFMARIESSSAFSASFS